MISHCHLASKSLTPADESTVSMERRATVVAWWDRLMDGRSEVRASTAPELSAESSFGGKAVTWHSRRKWVVWRRGRC